MALLDPQRDAERQMKRVIYDTELLHEAADRVRVVKAWFLAWVAIGSGLGILVCVVGLGITTTNARIPAWVYIVGLSLSFADAAGAIWLLFDRRVASSAGFGR